MRRQAHRQRDADRARQPRGAAPGADHDPLVLGARAAGPHLDRAAAGRAHGDHLVGDERIPERAAERRDRGRRANGAARLVEHGRAVVGREQRLARGELLAIDPARRHAADGLEHPQALLDPVAERHRAIARDQLRAEPLAPLVVEPPAVAREGHEPGVVVGVAEDASLAAGLAVAGDAALVHAHAHPELPQRVGGAQPGDAGADDRDRRLDAHGTGAGAGAGAVCCTRTARAAARASAWDSGATGSR